MTKKIKVSIVAGLFLIIGFVAYVHIWEMNQEKVVIAQATIEKVTPYRKSGGDLHWNLRGFRIYIIGEKRPIDFPMRNWNKKVIEGSIVQLTIRKSFFGEEFDGLQIETIGEEPIKNK